MTTRLLRWGIGLVAASLALLVATVLGGELGTVAVGIGLAGLMLILLSRRLPAAPAPAAHRPAPVDGLGPYQAFRSIRFTLGWATAADAAYRPSRAVRPVLTRLTAAVLAHRHRIDLQGNPDRARALLGPDLWRLVDPHGQTDGDAAVADEDIHQLVDRLEEL
jgi:hypothetical protein